MFSDVFRGYGYGIFAWNGLNNTSLPAICFHIFVVNSCFSRKRRCTRNIFSDFTKMRAPSFIPISNCRNKCKTRLLH